MKKWFLSALLLVTPLHAYFYSDPGDVGVGVEWIYFRPLIDDQYFVGINTQPPAGAEVTRVKNKPHTHSGFRVSEYYSFLNGCKDFNLRYTQLQTRYKKTELAPGASLAGGTTALYTMVGDMAILAEIPAFFQGPIPFAFAHADSTFHYYSGEGNFSFKLFNRRFFTLGFMGGAHFAWLSNSNDYTFTTDPTFTSAPNTSFFVNDRTRFWGIGPQIGSDFNLYLFGDVSLVARASGGLLIGRSQSSTRSSLSFSSAFSELENEHNWRVVPFQNYRLGLNFYMHCLCRVKFNLEAGYELLTYFRAFDTIIKREGALIATASSPKTAFSADTYNNVGMHGPYISVILSF